MYPETLNDSIERHYRRGGLFDAIVRALAAAGKDVDRLTLEDLAPVDQFHIRGRDATLELARAAGIAPGQHVLDVGCGIGGASRSLAREFGCRVIGVDLTDEYCSVATRLAERVGLSDLVNYRRADAVALPFDDETFDVVWSQHAAMNIPDKPALYRGMHRVLKPGGTLAIYDILAGPGGDVHYPVPWARSPDTSFLIAPEPLRRLLEATGFAIESWLDTTEAGREWFARLSETMRQGGLPPLGIQLLLGPDFVAMGRNQRRNLDEGRIVLAQVVARKP